MGLPLLGRLAAAAFGANTVASLSASETVAVHDLLADVASAETPTRATACTVDNGAILVVPIVRD